MDPSYSRVCSRCDMLVRSVPCIARPALITPPPPPIGIVKVILTSSPFPFYCIFQALHWRFTPVSHPFHTRFTPVSHTHSHSFTLFPTSSPCFPHNFTCFPHVLYNIFTRIPHDITTLTIRTTNIPFLCCAPVDSMS